jgi:predicted membrane channel-forming protein YqfA (hemolysin III family)
VIRRFGDLTRRQEMTIALGCFGAAVVGVGLIFLADTISTKWLAYLGIGIFLVAWLGMAVVVLHGIAATPRRIADNLKTLWEMPPSVRGIAFAALVGLLVNVFAAYADLGPWPFVGGIVFLGGALYVAVYSVVWNRRHRQLTSRVE